MTTRHTGVPELSKGETMLKTAMRITATIAIWCLGCAVADYLLPADLARCWLMLWGCVLLAVQTVIVRYYLILFRRRRARKETMTRMTTTEEELDRIEFARKAAQHFANNPKHWSFGDLKPETFLALRWGMGDDCVLVLKLDPTFEPINYRNLVRQFQRDE